MVDVPPSLLGPVTTYRAWLAMNEALGVIAAATDGPPPAVVTYSGSGVSVAGFTPSNVQIAALSKLGFNPAAADEPTA